MHGFPLLQSEAVKVDLICVFLGGGEWGVLWLPPLDFEVVLYRRPSDFCF